MNYTHPKEKRYELIGKIFGALFWLSPMGWVSFAMLPFIAFSLWWTRKFLETHLYGHSIQLSEHQYPEIYELVLKHSQTMGLKSPPEVFIMESGGYKNALAARFLSKKYVLLFSELVSSCLEADDGSMEFIVAHEIAHHAKGHTSFWRNLWMLPTSIFPPLFLAWKRNCEYTADGVAMSVCSDPKAAAAGLAILAGKPFKSKTNINIPALMAQEHKMPKLFSFYQEIYSSHPRITLRLQHLNQAYVQITQNANHQSQISQPTQKNQPTQINQQEFKKSA